MRKIFCAVILAVFLASSLFAASPKSSGLTESDIDAFIENFDEIDRLLEEKLDDIDADIDIEDNTLSEVLSVIPADRSRDISKELNKLGISGSNALEKVFVITYGTAYSYIKSFYDLMAMLLEDDDDSLAEFDAMMEIYTSSVSDDDFEVINKKIEELAEVLGFTNDTTSVDDYDWSDYDYDYDWDDYDYGDDYNYYDWDDYDWSDYDWGDDDYEYDWDDYDWSDYDWDDDDYEYYTEEEELESETGVKFLKELMPSLSSRSGSADFLYKTIKPGTYKTL